MFALCQLTLDVSFGTVPEWQSAQALGVGL
jgi:hypothetical protein